MSGHAFLAPSAAGDWERCTGAPALRALYPEPPSEPGSPAAEGTAAHEVAADFVRRVARGELLPTEAEVVGVLASNGETITGEMYEGAALYSRDILAVMRKTGVFTVHVEEPTEAGGIHDQCWGTPDCWLWDDPNARLYKWDLKFGYRPVEPTAPQCVCYTADILQQLGVSGLDDQHVTVVDRIVQPRGYHRSGPIREWRGLASDLRPRINKLRYAAEEACGSGAKCVPGPQCTYCSARPCDVLRASNLDKLRWIGAPGVTPMGSVDAGVELKLLRMARDELTAHITGLEAQLIQAIGAGEYVPGWAQDRTMGRLNWIRAPDEVFALGELIGIDLRKPPEPITPTQAIGRGADRELIEQYSARKPGAVKLIEDHSNTRAKEVFENDD